MLLNNKTRVSRLFLGNSNVFIIASGEDIAIVDGGLGNRSGDVCAEIERLGRTPENIKFIFVTHAHYDHVGSIRQIKKRFPQAKIVAHQLEADNLKNGLSPVPAGTMWFSKPVSWLGCKIFRHCIRFPGFEADLTFSENLLLTLGNTEIECFHTPGHTEGSICIRLDNEAVFAGDSIFHLLPGCFYPPFADSTEKLAKSWNKIKATGVRMVFPGHGRRFPLSLLPNG